jgi:DNA replication protein DnaC
MSEPHPELRVAAIRQQCRQLQLPAVSAQCGRLAEEAGKAQHSHLAYLEALLGAELEEREQRAIARRIKEAHFPRLKTLEEFDFAGAPQIPAALIRSLAEGEYLRRAEPVLFLGETGTGKTHLATGLAVAACRQRRRVRFTTAAALVTELVEAQHHHQLSRVTNRWAHCDLVVIDELGYVALAEVGAELLFQLIAERAEKAAVMATTNLPFSEWTTVFPNARLCQALLDRLTDRAHIIETGTASYRFRRTVARRQKPGPPRAAPARGGSAPTDCGEAEGDGGARCEGGEAPRDGDGPLGLRLANGRSGAPRERGINRGNPDRPRDSACGRSEAHAG